MTVAVYPGSFDPVTFGHLDILARAAEVFDRLIVAVLTNPRKAPLLSSEERIDVLRRSIADELPALSDRVDIEAFDGLTVEFCRAKGVRSMVRGLRAISDFETEMLLAHNNRRLAPDIDTVFFMTSLEQSYVSSSLVREIAQFGGDIGPLVPGPAAEALGRALHRAPVGKA
jgi:pantetheine-phosphate adenylyltransferase